MSMMGPPATVALDAAVAAAEAALAAIAGRDAVGGEGEPQLALVGFEAEAAPDDGAAATAVVGPAVLHRFTTFGAFPATGAAGFIDPAGCATAGSDISGRRGRPPFDIG